MPAAKGSIPWNAGTGAGWTDKRGYRDGMYVRDADCPLHGIRKGNTDIHDPEAT